VVRDPFGSVVPWKKVFMARSNCNCATFELCCCTRYNVSVYSVTVGLADCADLILCRCNVVQMLCFADVMLCRYNVVQM
jgi:hypothetical protein